MAKNTGAKNDDVSRSRECSSRSSTKRERCSTTPATNAPTTASTPRPWVTTPKPSIVTTATVTAAPRVSLLRRVRRSQRSTSHWPTVRASTMNSSRPPTEIRMSVAETPPAATTLVRTPSSTQPTTSLAMPTATVIWPKSRRMSPRSERILATTASADTLTARATNSRNVLRVASGPRNSPGISQPTMLPAPAGTSMLPTATSTAGRPSLAIRPRSVSKPASTSSSATPIQLTVSSAAACSPPAGRNHSNCSGQ